MKRVLFVSLFAITALTACADDATEWSVVVVVNDTTLTSGSAENTRVLVSVLDQDRNPAVQGSSVRLQCLNAANGELIGSLGGLQAGIAQALTDTSGIATFEFSCGQDGTLDAQIVCQGVYEDVREAGPVITCAPAE